VFKRSKETLSGYSDDFMSAERHYRRKAGDWRSIIQELHADRGILLGSTQYAEMNGIERGKALGVIEDAVQNAYNHIEELKHLRDSAVDVPVGFKYRAKIARKKILVLSDEALGVVE
jgi:hypothetical protein